MQTAPHEMRCCDRCCEITEAKSTFEAKCKNYLGESVVVESCCWPGGRIGGRVFHLDNMQVMDESIRITKARAIPSGTLCKQ